jgi:uracil-DNA glycosylase family 4
MKGFFSDDHIETKLTVPLLPRCSICQLDKQCHSPKMPVSGQGKRQILIVGEAPGATEDQRGVQFCGESGALLESTLADLGLDMRKDCWITNSVICRPPKNDLPPKAIDYCRPNVVNAIKELKPKTILLLGSSPVKSVIGWLWKDDVDALGRWVGWRIPCQSINAWLCPTWHPAYLLRAREGKEGEVTMLWWKKHLKAALKLQGRPWQQVPDYDSLIQIEMDDRKAARIIRELADTNMPLALDYETNMLKPDSKEFEVVSCAISDGITSVAYPWYGRAIAETRRVLESDHKLIASNMKFEARVNLALFGHVGKGWWWDTMQAAHLLDNRSKITSIKFQAFALLGAASWDGHIKPFLQSKGSNIKNRIKELDLKTLLKYNALDSLLESHVAIKQRQLLRMTGG